MKYIAIGFILILLSVSAGAQIHSTRAELIKYYGSNYEKTYSSERRLHNLVYTFTETTEASGTYEYIFLLCFTEDNDESLCVSWVRIEPKTEANNQVRWVRSKDFVQLEDLKWVDYVTNTFYKIEIDLFCITTAETSYAFK